MLNSCDAWSRVSSIFKTRSFYDKCKCCCCQSVCSECYVDNQQLLLKYPTLNELHLKSRCLALITFLYQQDLNKYFRYSMLGSDGKATTLEIGGAGLNAYGFEFGNLTGLNSATLSEFTFHTKGNSRIT
jgi:hypothetical protein